MRLLANATSSGCWDYFPPCLASRSLTMAALCLSAATLRAAKNVVNKLVAPFFTQPVAFQSKCCGGVLDGNWFRVDCVHRRESFSHNLAN
jgi:hypothetical protein